MTVITMSRQVGSGAEEIATRLCQELGLTVFDRRLMARVAHEMGITEQEILDYSEEQFERRGLFETLFRRSRPVAEVTVWTKGREEGYELEARVLDEDAAVNLIRDSIRTAYQHGNVLIIGRGGQAILEDMPGVFHVRVVAPLEYRIAKLCAQEQITEKQARRLLATRDRATAEYLRVFHNIEVEDPTLYHVVLNTGKLNVDQCVSLVKAAAQEVIIATPGA